MSTTLKSKYLPAFDGLRAVSILIVYVAHMLGFSGISQANLVPGGLGVTIFFFISGFLITRLLLEEQQEHHEISLKNFYIRRFLRLYPVLVAYLICATILFWITTHTISGKELLIALFYCENYYMIFGNGNIRYGILWTLAIEEHFYLFTPCCSCFLPGFRKNFLLSSLYS